MDEDVKDAVLVLPRGKTLDWAAARKALADLSDAEHYALCSLGCEHNPYAIPEMSPGEMADEIFSCMLEHGPAEERVEAQRALDDLERIIQELDAGQNFDGDGGYYREVRVKDIRYVFPQDGYSHPEGLIDTYFGGAGVLAAAGFDAERSPQFVRALTAAAARYPELPGVGQSPDI